MTWWDLEQRTHLITNRVPVVRCRIAKRLAPLPHLHLESVRSQRRKSVIQQRLSDSVCLLASLNDAEPDALKRAHATVVVTRRKLEGVHARVADPAHQGVRLTSNGFPDCLECGRHIAVYRIVRAADASREDVVAAASREQTGVLDAIQQHKRHLFEASRYGDHGTKAIVRVARCRDDALAGP